jgi:hypothetical protein
MFGTFGNEISKWWQSDATPGTPTFLKELIDLIQKVEAESRSI